MASSFFVCLSLSAGCGSSDPAPAPARQAATEPSPAASAAQGSAAPAASARDPRGLPDYVAAAPSCQGTGADPVPLRERLRQLERAAEPEPPTAASLLEGCLLTPTDVSRSLVNAARAFSRRHDDASAAKYLERAIEIDPSSLAARYALVAARSKTGDIDGALYQLEQVRGAGSKGERFVKRASTDGALSALRARRAYWTWAHDPVPDAVAALAADATDTGFGSPLATLRFEPPLAVTPDVLHERVRFESPHYRVVGDSVHQALGQIFRGYRGLRREDLVASPWLEQVGTIGLEFLGAPTIFRFVDSESVLAIPFYGELEGTVGPVALVAKGPNEGPFEIVQILRPTDECAEPVLLASRDRRVLAWPTRCGEGVEVASMPRCLAYARDGATVVRCGGGSAAVTSSDEASEEEADEGDYGD
ncbi:MAG: hypothetical protein U0230_10620 [Polyangiales bacterium]